MFQIIKDNLLSIVIVIVAIVLGVQIIPPQAKSTYDIIVQADKAKKEFKSLQEQENNLRMQAEMSSKQKAVSRDSKRIYELEGTQFSGEASFAPLFEIVLNIAQTSGIRIRSIDYNYQPQEDKIFASRIAEYNVCELSIVAVGTYAQLQNFFKGLMKDPNLNYLAEIEMQPWEKDKTILISNMKVRLYTKTPGAPTSASIPAETPAQGAAAPTAPALP